MDKSTGRIVQITGGVVDVEFPEGELPSIFEAIEIPREGQPSLILEVQRDLGKNWFRCLSMGTTDGLRRGLPAYRTGKSIQVPVGPTTLGRIFDVLGRPVDGLGPVKSDLYYPIHRPAPTFDEQTTQVEVFETGL
ncbi:MAG TPA: F0F1 ATP synthase subunit beta, partial [Anaerolineaceae bacterium]|nr:F0F1 ATP synthase subunit beta [Anaerolineaceae bacterium]